MPRVSSSRLLPLGFAVGLVACSAAEGDAAPTRKPTPNQGTSDGTTGSNDTGAAGNGTHATPGSTDGGAPDAGSVRPIDFNAIVDLGDCSGSVVRFKTSKASDLALVLTNGHCHDRGFIAAGTAIAGELSTRLLPLLAPDGKSVLTNLETIWVFYGTMTGSDFLLYTTSQSYAVLENAFAVRALTIADQRSVAGIPIRIPTGRYKTIYACALDGFVPELVEGDWTWQDSLRYKPNCGTIPGTSGSPILDPATGEVIGINNTGNDDGARCTINNPCEKDAAGAVTVTKGAEYGQQVYGIYDCLSAQNTLDVTRPSCKLTKPPAR